MEGPGGGSVGCGTCAGEGGPALGLRHPEGGRVLPLFFPWAAGVRFVLRCLQLQGRWGREGCGLWVNVKSRSCGN